MNQQHKPWKITLVGDGCIDNYVYGSVDRISPEAPIPIFKEKYTDIKAGMIFNVSNNFKNLQCKPSQYTANDKSIKTRYVDEKTNYQILRVDEDTNERISDVKLIDTSSDAIVITDYNKGFLTYSDIEYLIRAGNELRIPVYIDTKKPDLSRFNGAYLKINEDEYHNKTSPPDYHTTIITKGGKEVLWYGESFPTSNIKVNDVCGAGDTFFASFVKKHLDTKNISQSIKFAIKAAAITVQHMGVYAPTLEEIEND